MAHSLSPSLPCLYDFANICTGVRVYSGYSRVKILEQFLVCQGY